MSTDTVWRAGRPVKTTATDVVRVAARAHFYAALDRACREHKAEPGIPCWALPGEFQRGLRVALCGDRLRSVLGRGASR